jgi:threonine/homoserine efflux transporter RhtA
MQSSLADELRKRRFARRGRVLYICIAMMVLDVFGIAFLFALIQTERLDMFSFTFGASMGLLVAAIWSAYLWKGARAGQVVDGSVLIEGRRLSFGKSAIIGVLTGWATILIFNIAEWAVGRGAVDSFVFGLLCSAPPAVLLVVFLMEGTFGRLYILAG